MRLHLGCGDVRLPGFVNVDRIYQPAVDIVDNIGTLRNRHIRDQHVEEIYSCHALDHFDRWTYKTVLKRWFDVLASGGLLRLSMPDWSAALKYYEVQKDLEDLIGHLYAGQDYPDNVRHWIWNFSTAAKDLMEVGFVDVQTYDAWEWFTDPFKILGGIGPQDCSTLSWKRGSDTIQRSLNIIATKP